jgi:hypothetical protein
MLALELQNSVPGDLSSAKSWAKRIYRCPAKATQLQVQRVPFWRCRVRSGKRGFARAIRLYGLSWCRLVWGKPPDFGGIQGGPDQVQVCWYRSVLGAQLSPLELTCAAFSLNSRSRCCQVVGYLYLNVSGGSEVRN